MRQISNTGYDDFIIYYNNVQKLLFNVCEGKISYEFIQDFVFEKSNFE